MADPTPPPEEAVRVYDDAGQAYDLPQGEAEARVRSGELGFRPDQQVILRDDAGQLVPVTGAEAARRLGSYQYGLGGQGAYAEQETARQYEGGLQGLRAAAAGGLSALTLGGSDAALSAVGGDEMRQDLANLRRYRPGATMAGEAGGLLLPALVSGGSSLALRGATAAPRALAAAGGLAERAAVRGLVGAGAAEGGILARAGGLAAGQALEMGAYTAGQEFSRQVLANEALSGERLFTAFGHGAVFGAGGGALLGAAGAVGSRAIGAAREGVAGLGQRVAGRAGELLDQGAALAERAGGKAVGEAAPTLVGKAQRLAEAALPGGVEGFAAQKALQSTGATPTMLRNLEAMGPSARGRVVQQMEESLPALVGKEPGAILSRAELAEAAAKNVDAVGSQIGDSLRALDASTTKVRPSVAEAMIEARNTIVKDLKSSPFTRRQGDQLEALVNDIENSLVDPTFSELHKQRQLLDRQIRFEAQSPTIGQEALRDLRGIIEREIERSAEVAAKDLGADFAATYKAAKEQYGAAKWLEEATAAGAAREGTNASLGLREMLGAIGGSNVGATVGGAIAGPVGSLVGGAVGGVTSAYLNNLAKRYGDQTVAFALRKLGQGAGPVEVANAVLDQVVGQSVAGYLRKGAAKAEATGREVARAAGMAVERTTAAAGRAAKGAAAGSVRAFERRQGEQEEQTRRYQEARARVAAAATQAERGRLVNRALPPGTTPAMAEAAQRTADKAALYLQSKMPPEPARMQTLTPNASSRITASPMEQQRFLSAVRAIEDPTTLLADMAAGRADPDVIEAVRAVYPEFFADVGGRVQAQLTERADDLDYDKALALGAMLGVVAHPSQDPAFIARQQAMYAEASAAAGGAPPRPSRAVRSTASLYDPDTKEIAS